MAQKEAKWVYASRVQASMKRVVKKAFSDALQIEFDSANDDLKTASFCFVKCVLTEMTQTGVLEKVFDCSIERWT